MARPTKYEDIDLIKIEKLAGYGLIDDEIADLLGIVRSTLSIWKKEHEEFSDALKRGKVRADTKVVKSLFKRATGYQFKEITRELRDDELTITKEVTKEIAPDPIAAIFWLKNRRPQDWKDKQIVDHRIKGKVIKVGYGNTEQ
jgi:transcriptional regulator with XRE-family HTH domain